MIESVSVVGLGKLGSCVAACMASKGMRVVGVDVNPDTVRLVNEGHSPVVEPGLQGLLETSHGALTATMDTRSAVLKTDATFIIVPTPSDASGGFSLEYVLEAVVEIGRALRQKAEYHLVVVTSTVLPGAAEHEIRPVLERESGKRCGQDFGLCYNPEFIALGSVIHDLMNPDLVLVGESDERSGSALAEWYGKFCDNSPQVVRTNLVNAEIAKISVNTFVSTKITFANMLASICEQVEGGDVDAVARALGLDSRIGRRYLTGALSYGGPCFPRDNRALAHFGEKLGCNVALLETTDAVNRALVQRHIDRIRCLARPGMTVGVLGLAYKPDTNVVEDAAGIAIASSLADGGGRVLVFDRLAMDNAQRILGSRVRYAASLAECVGASDLAVITNPCAEFRALGPVDFPRRDRHIVVFDCWRILRDKLESCPWIDYVAIGVGESPT